MSRVQDRTLAWTAPLLVAMCVTVALLMGLGEPGVRTIVRATARTSALLVCLALSSWTIDALAPRRAGLIRSLAVSHGLHLVAVLGLAALTGGANLAERAEAVTAIGGLLAYAVIFAGGVRPRLPFVEWGLLWVAVSFLFAYAPRAARSPWLYGPAVGALLIAIALRIAGAFVRRAPLEEDAAA
jgi:hypothetical protein